MAPPTSSRKKITTAAATTTASGRCSKCGWTIAYTSKCLHCLPRRTHITDLIPRKTSIVHCPGCSSYLLPPRSWVPAATGSIRLRRFCESLLVRPFPRRITCTGSRFLPSPDPKSLIRLNLFLRGEISPGSISNRSYVVEFDIQHRLCPHCSFSSSAFLPESEEATSTAAEYKVELRRYVPGRVCFISLEWTIVHDQGGGGAATQIIHVDHGLDFFFPDRTLALDFAEFVTRIFPVRPLPSSDGSNTSVSLEICPVMENDLTCLPPLVSKSLGNFGPLVICTRITNCIHLMDVINLRTASLDAEQYWGVPFQRLLSPSCLVEYVVLDVMVVGGEEEDGERQAAIVTNTTVVVRPALMKVTRASDFGMGNCKAVMVRTHLGGTLLPGDYADGYDLSGENIRNHADVRAYEGLEIPEVLLVRKFFKLNTKMRMGELRARKLKGPNAKEKVDDGYEQFLKSLEKNPEAMLDISFQRCEGYQPQPEECRPSLVGEGDGCDPTDTDSMME